MTTLIFLGGACGFACINIFTLLFLRVAQTTTPRKAECTVFKMSKFLTSTEAREVAWLYKTEYVIEYNYSCLLYKQYYPSSNQFRDPPTYTHQPSMQQKVPFSLISCSSSKVAFCSCVEWGWHIYNIVESESDPLTRRAVDLFEKEPLKGNSEVHLHTPTKFGEDRSKDLGGDREQTDRQTNRQTDKRCSIYSMMCLVYQQTYSSYLASTTNIANYGAMALYSYYSCLDSQKSIPATYSVQNIHLSGFHRAEHSYIILSQLT